MESSKRLRRTSVHFLLAFLTSSVFLLATLATPTAAAKPLTGGSNPAAAIEILALVNEWRLENGLWPLKTNPTLEQMALDQANYVLPNLSSISDEADYHKDAQGRDARTRAVSESYNWPRYDGFNTIRIGENAAVGSAKFAMNFWKTSSIHKKAALNTDYREVGVAALPIGSGTYLYFMDFGARPGVMPTFINPAGDTLYFSNDCYCTPKSKPLTTQITIFNTDGTPLVQRTDWKATLILPNKVTGTLYVLYVNGNDQNLSLVNPSTDQVVLSGNSVAVRPQATVTSTAVLSTPMPRQTIIPIATSPGSDVTPVSTATVAPTVTPVGGTPDLILVYNDRALIIYNNSVRPANLTGFAIGNDTNRIAIQSWTAVAPFSVSTFQSGSCLAVQAPSAATLPTNNCKFVRSAITVSSAKVFWGMGTFSVFLNDTVYQTCLATDKRCEVALNQTQRRGGAQAND